MSKAYIFTPEKRVIIIGQTFIFNDLTLTLSQEIVNNNPKLFKPIKEKLFRTLNGTNVYPDKNYYIVHENNLTIDKIFIDNSNYRGFMNKYLFSTIKEAEEDLYDYVISSANDYNSYKEIMRSKILLFLSKSLNGDWKPTEHNDKFIIMEDFTIDEINDLALTDIPFKSKSIADRAIEILKLCKMKLMI